MKMVEYHCSRRPFVPNGAKSWTLINKIERALMIWEGKILRKIYANESRNLL
jgi:hypothetical protein